MLRIALQAGCGQVLRIAMQAGCLLVERQALIDGNYSARQKPVDDYGDDYG